MASAYYKPCPELDRCNALIDQYWYSGQYDLCFRGHLELRSRVILWRNVKLDISI